MTGMREINTEQKNDVYSRTRRDRILSGLCLSTKRPFYSVANFPLRVIYGT